MSAPFDCPFAPDQLLFPTRKQPLSVSAIMQVNRQPSLQPRIEHNHSALPLIRVPILETQPKLVSQNCVLSKPSYNNCVESTIMPIAKSTVVDSIAPKLVDTPVITTLPMSTTIDSMEDYIETTITTSLISDMTDSPRNVECPSAIGNISVQEIVNGKSISTYNLLEWEDITQEDILFSPSLQATCTIGSRLDMEDWELL